MAMLVSGSVDFKLKQKLRLFLTHPLENNVRCAQKIR